jgi:hypothetical protein
MIVKFMGFLDLCTALVIFLAHHDSIAWRFPVASSLYLFAKAYAFKGDLVSLIDLIIGLYIFAILIGWQFFITYIIIIYLLQKALFSFF